MEVSTLMIIMGSIYAACVLAGAIVVFVLTLKNRGTVKEAVQAVQDFVSATKGNSMVKMNVAKSEENVEEVKADETEKEVKPVVLEAKSAIVSTSQAKSAIVSTSQIERLIDNLSDDEAKEIFNKLFERFIK